MKNFISRGFSLIELIVVIAVIAVIAATIIPSISGTTDAAKMQNAIAAAGTLNLAQVQYRLKGSLTTWDAAASSEARYNLLVGAGCLEFSESWTNFLKRYDNKFTFDIKASSGGKMQKIVLKKNGTEVNY